MYIYIYVCIDIDIDMYIYTYIRPADSCNKIQRAHIVLARSKEQ